MFKPKSFHLQWHITERCNLHCKHCYTTPSFLKDELSFKELKNIFENYLKQLKIWDLSREDSRISLTGGEPFLRDDFFDFLELFYKNRENTQYGILSNGILLTDEKADKLKDLNVNYFQVSLEGPRKINDEIRGKGTFDKIINSIFLLKEKEIPVYVSMTVSKMNYKYVPFMVRLSQKLKVDFLSIRQIIPFGRGKQLKKRILSPQETKDLFLYFLKIKRNKNFHIGMGCEDGILSQEMRYSPKGCSAGYTSMTILPNGDVYPCRRLPLFSGNLLKQPFREIYYNSEIFKKIRNLNNINKICSTCPFVDNCNGGAKCINYAYFGNVFSPSPQCWRLLDSLPDRDCYNEDIKTKQQEERLNENFIKKF